LIPSKKRRLLKKPSLFYATWCKGIDKPCVAVYNKYNKAEELPSDGRLLRTDEKMTVAVGCRRLSFFVIKTRNDGKYDQGDLEQIPPGDICHSITSLAGERQIYRSETLVHRGNRRRSSNSKGCLGTVLIIPYFAQKVKMKEDLYETV
jgi:hypothetical protein